MIWREGTEAELSWHVTDNAQTKTYFSFCHSAKAATTKLMYGLDIVSVYFNVDKLSCITYVSFHGDIAGVDRLLCHGEAAENIIVLPIFFRGANGPEHDSANKQGNGQAKIRRI